MGKPTDMKGLPADWRPGDVAWLRNRGRHRVVRVDRGRSPEPMALVEDDYRRRVWSPLRFLRREPVVLTDRQVNDFMACVLRQGIAGRFPCEEN